MSILYTARLELRPVTLEIVAAILEGRRRSDIEKLVGAEMPWEWPGRAVVEQAFSASLDAVRSDPATRLWGDHFMITRDAPPRVVGSVIFHGKPDATGRCQIAYGVEDSSQRRGYATEAVTAMLAWALAQPECKVVEATTMPWHKASARVLEKVGMKLSGTRPYESDHPGEHGANEAKEQMLVYEMRRPG